MIKRMMSSSRLRKVVLALFDIVCFAAVDLLFYIMATGMDYSIPVHDLSAFLINSALMLVMIFGMRLILGVYRTVWRYTSTKAYFSMVLADCIGGIAAVLVARTVYTYCGIWHFVTVASFTALASLSSRFAYRLVYKKQQAGEQTTARRSTAIVGAGQLGTFLANDLRSNPNSEYEPMFFVDIDRGKIGNAVAGLKVYGTKQIGAYLEKYGITDVIVAITGIDSDTAYTLYQFYRELGCRVKIYDSLAHEVSGTRVVRDFQIEDVLFRKPLKFNDSRVRDYYAGKTVLVTGGGGSIGSELCRQIAHCHPKCLILLDVYENNAYDLQQELLRTWQGKLELAVVIASVRDRQRLEQIFAEYRPQVVFHAAAHKHVPLMEANAGEAVKNNILGTQNTADMAEKYGAEKFILISTDKAVNPTNVMGASKRVCEMIVQCRVDSATNFAAVRFGNVLGSNGSVIPLFKRQIAAGGPVTVTDKRIIRYFMTIQEASQLVIQAGAMARRGELFVLDMGKPVRIYDLAVNMIRLSGLRPEVDIPILEVGLRPGEKLYEELLIQSEKQRKTENDLIFVEEDRPLSREEVDRRVALLRASVETGDPEQIKAALAKTVPTYRDPGVINSEAGCAREMQMV